MTKLNEIDFIPIGSPWTEPFCLSCAYAYYGCIPGEVPNRPYSEYGEK